MINNNNNQWNSRIAFLLSMIGAAVGLGNIWRYSYVVYSNGGGTFFIPYLVAILIMGIPFLILEYGIGFRHKDSFSNILKSINPRLEYISWALVLTIYFVLIYYLVIVGWDLVYLGSSLNFNWGTNSALYFLENVGGSSNLSNMTNFIIPTLISTVIVWIMVWYISHKDLNEGIGKASKILIPLLFGIMLIIIVFALTLPGANIGINTLLKPDWQMLLNVNIWLAAFSQILFSLSMGESISLTYASYLPEGSKLTSNVLIVVFANCAFEVCTAFGIFSILGYMSYTSGTPMTKLVSEGAIAVFEPMINSTIHKLNWSRKKTVTILSIVGCILSLLFTTGISSYLVGIVDTFITEFCILLLIAIQCIIFGWFYDIEAVIPILNKNDKVKVGKTWMFILKYILPIFLFVMWGNGVYNLLLTANNFELLVYIIITVAILILSYIFINIKDKSNES